MSIPNEYIKINCFIYCSGKSGGTTLSKTMHNNGFNVTHIHSNNCLGNFNQNVIDINIIKPNELIKHNSTIHDKIYVIDSYRNPIERKYSSFFQNIEQHVPNNKNIDINELVNIFNEKYLYDLEEYQSINEVFEFFNIPLFKEFDFSKKYNVIQKNNIIFIKLRFIDIEQWDDILSEIFNKKIILYSDNLSSEKDYNNIYKEFKEKYMVPQYYLTNYLPYDKNFKIYNTKEEYDNYYNKWKQKSIL